MSDSTGRYLYFEGSYTKALTGEGVLATPRYDRNQIMYRLAVDDERLTMPVAVYDLAADGTGAFGTKRALRAKRQRAASAFFAPERATANTLAVAWTGPACGKAGVLMGAEPERGDRKLRVAPRRSSLPRWRTGPTHGGACPPAFTTSS